MHKRGPDSHANFRHSRKSGCNLVSMGRGAGSHSAAGAGASRREADHPAAWITRRLKAYIGLDVIGHGYLAEPYGGHAAGTPYVDISATCAMDREKARRILAPTSGLPELAWECGWRGRQLPNGQQDTQLRLFPGATTASATT